jgi:hypothetical protein
MVFDCDVRALDVASFAYALPKGGLEVRAPFGRAVVQKANHRHGGLLRARRQRPRRRAAKCRDELAPPHVCPVRTRLV